MHNHAQGANPVIRTPSNQEFQQDMLNKVPSLFFAPLRCDVSKKTRRNQQSLLFNAGWRKQKTKPKHHIPDMVMNPMVESIRKKSPGKQIQVSHKTKLLLSNILVGLEGSLYWPIITPT